MRLEKQGQGVDVGRTGDCAELPEGLRGVFEERLEAGLNGLVIVENTSGDFLSCHFFVHRFFVWYWESGMHAHFPEKRR